MFFDLRGLVIVRSKRLIDVKLGRFKGALACAPLSTLLFAMQPGVANAQAIEPLVPLSLNPAYNRGRNVGVDEQVPPLYQALGVRSGSILAFPSLSIVTGATSNVFVTDAFKKSDAFYSIRPAIRIGSDFTRHQVNLTASANIERYAHEEIRNQNAYTVDASGRLDIGNSLQITAQVLLSRSAETPYVSDLAADISVLSFARRFNPSILAIYAGQGGRARITAKVEELDLSFSNVDFADGSQRVQTFRDRKVYRGTGQFEYALSPSIALFSQVTLETTNYDLAFREDGLASRDGKSRTVLAGVNFDLAGFMRGTIGFGHAQRNYDAPIYRDSGGLAAQVQAEVFLSPLTTLGVTGQRTTQDSGSSFNGAYTDSRLSVNVDHALLRNLILTANLLLVSQKLIETKAIYTRTLSSINARYQSNRFISIGANVQYGRGNPGNNNFGTKFGELRGQVVVNFRR